MFVLLLSALQAAGLAVHVFDDDVVDFAEGHHVLEDFIRFVRMEVELDELVITDDEEFLPFEVGANVSVDIIFVQVFPLKEKLEVITRIDHRGNVPFV